MLKHWTFTFYVHKPLLLLTITVVSHQYLTHAQMQFIPLYLYSQPTDSHNLNVYYTAYS